MSFKIELSDEEIQRIRRLRSDGFSYGRIAKMVGHSKSTCNSYARDVRKGQLIRPPDMFELKAMRRVFDRNDGYHLLLAPELTEELIWAEKAHLLATDFPEFADWIKAHPIEDPWKGFKEYVRRKKFLVRAGLDDPYMGPSDQRILKEIAHNPLLNRNQKYVAERLAFNSLSKLFGKRNVWNIRFGLNEYGVETLGYVVSN